MTENPASKQTWSAEQYDKHARFVSDLGGEILSWLAPQQGERILDLGCGDGALTEKIAALGVDIVGVDASEDLLKAAQNRGLNAHLMDGHSLTFDKEFDAVFSNAALHWMLQPELVIAGIARALKPGGRFVAEFGGHGNVAAIITAMRAVGVRYNGDLSIAGPWFYPTPQEYSDLLKKYGFQVLEIGLFARPTPLPTGMEGWLLHFRKPFFEQFGVQQDLVLKEAVELLRPSLCDSKGQWSADYMRLKVKAVLS